MHALIFRSMRAAVALTLMGLVTPTTLWAANGTWTESTGDGLWSSSANWTGGVVADGANNTANFSTVDVSAAAVNTAFPGFYRNAVQVDSPRTIGSLVFGDANTATPGGWEVYTNDITTNVLTLDGTAPSITVNPLGPIDTSTLGDETPELIDDALFSTGRLGGTNGFTKLGAGTLTLGGNNSTLTGTINVNQGKLRIRTGATFDFETATTAAVTRFALAGGAEIETQVGLGQNAALPAAAGISIAPGATATITNTATNSQFFANVGGLGSTLNFNIATGGALTTTLDRDWAAGGAMARVNFKGTAATQSQVRMRINGGTFGGFGSTEVNLDNVMIFTNTNSGGNTNPIGALSGTATGTLQGGAAGTVATYTIGGLNTNTTFAGNITTGNGINIFKVGTGTLELSGTLSYQPRADVNLPRRGGITRVEAGTLKLTGPAAIMGGIDDTGTATNGGLLYSTIDIRAGATLDVSGVAAKPYSTAAIQQVIGAGNIVGDYNHDEGVLAPGDGLTGGNTANLIATAGTLTFANTLSFAGNGQINFDISPSLTSGNDRINVGGAILTGTPVLKVGFLGGATAGQYTVLHSTTPLAGSVSGWTVNWEGRGTAPSLVQTANDVKLDLGNITTGSLNWRGNVDGVWNAGAVAGTANWQNTATNTSDKFFQLDSVAFRDTYDGVNAPTTTAITLNTIVSPMAVTVNSALNYSISGTGRITGGSALNKQGAGTLTLTTANDYTGGTTISGGAIKLGGTGALGSGTVAITNAELHAGEAGNFNLPNAIVLAGTSNVISNDNNASQTLNLQGNISGTGTLNLQNNSVGAPTADPPTGPVRNGIDLFGDNTGFHGAIVMSGPTSTSLRFRTVVSAGTDIAYDLGNNVDGQLSTVVGTNTTIPLGSLTGGVNVRISGHTSGSGVGRTEYRIGGLGTSTTFDGLIENGNTTTSADNVTAITKVGAGSLTLTFANTYSGDTRVEAGTLSITNPFLADTADVYLSNGSVFNLNFASTDIIDSLFINNVPQAIGTYGAPGSGATFTSSLFSGTGLLSVTTVGVLPVLIGDYNSNGVVDAADYTVWRNNLGSSTALANRDPLNSGNVSQADYDAWKAHFGQTGGSGSGLGGMAVPEPTSVVLLSLALGLLAGPAARRRRG